MADNLDNNMFIAMMTRFMEELSSKLGTKTTSDNSELLNQIKSLLSDIKNNQNAQTNTSTPETKQDTHTSPMQEAVVRAIKEATETIQGIVSEEKASKTILEEIAERQQKEVELSNAVKNGFNEVKKDIENLTHKVSNQLSTGKLELGPFSGFTNIMESSEKFYRNAVSMGQDYGGSIINMRNVMSQSGMTLDQFNKALMTGSQGLRMAGMNAFSGFAGAVNASVKALGDLGMTGDQLSETMSIYMDGLRTSGRLGTMNSQQMMVSYREFAFAATQLAHDVGISREEAMHRLNEARSAPDINILLRGMGEQQRNTINQLTGAVGNNPVLKSLLQSELFTARTGAAPTQEVSQTLSASGPAAYQSYREQSELIRRIMSSSSEQERRSLVTEWNRSLSRMANNIGEAQSVQNLYSNQYGQKAVGLYGAIQQYNPNQVAENTQTAPTTQAEVGGKTDGFTAAVLQTNHTMQEFVNHYDMFKNQLISSNKELIKSMIDAYNSMQQFLTKKIDSLTGLSKSTSGWTNPAASIVSGMANHPGLMLAGGLGIAALGHGAVGSLVRSVVRLASNYSKLRNLRKTGSISGSGSSGGSRIADTIWNTFKRLIPSSLRQSNSSSTSRIMNVAKSTGETIKNIPGARLASRTLGVVGAVGTVYGLASDAHTVLKSDANKSQEDKTKLGREKYRAYADMLSTVIGGAIGGIGTGMVSGGTLSIGGALAGSGIASTIANSTDIGGKVYDWTHPSLTHKPQDISNITKPSQQTQTKQDDNSETSSTNDQAPQTNNIPNNNSQPQDKFEILADNIDITNVLLRQVITKLDDMNRTIRNSSPTVH